ncbi:VOC family protein [Gordonia sp. PKS22-38]|uniref:VOC family protein n=1 Tax=Gordonia prachuapensis TaxID=3115651 RepID=A0ABU7MWX4_9ACTN|nr:VOC family protein [Gordonia sp. PKS22-38]
MTTSTPVASLAMMTLDCADARVSAEFWSAVLGWEIVGAGDGYAMLKGPEGAALGFGSVPGHRPPAWPNANGSKQFHFDLAVDDLAAAEGRCVELGATVPSEQPGETWRVLLDPAGHPFCLTKAENWG